jgi:hypothetical protein
MADTAFGSQVRGYVDSINSQRGINWKDISRHVMAGLPSKDLENWLYDKYGMDRAEAAKYTKAAEYVFKYNDGKYDSQFQSLLGDLTPPGVAPEAPDPNAQRRAGVTSQIQAFVDELGKTADMNDPVFAGLIRAGQAEAGARINQTGIRGGLADLTAADATNRAVLPYLAQRQQMRQTGLNALANRDSTLEQLDQGWANLNLQKQQLDNGQAMQQWAQGKNNAQTVGSAIGGGLGLAGGIIATAATGGAAAPLIPALAAGGSSLGGGLGGMAAPSYTPNPYRINTRPSSFSGY